MTAPDPLDVLRAPTVPVDPDPGFARDLRSRLESALLDLREEPVTITAPAEGPATAPATALPLHALTPYLAVVDARAAVDFYVDAFGARRRGEPIVMADGRVGHIEVALGDSVLMMADEYPEIGLVAPVNRGGVSQSLRLEVADPDAVVARAVEHGARLERSVADSPYGRGGVVGDPSGHRWMVSREAAAPRHGDITYASLWTPDVVRAERFYGDVLGWVTTAGSGQPGRQVTNLGSPVGLWGGQPRGTTFPCFAVPDVDAGAALVRAAGGSAEEPTDEPYGRLANCVDDQGVPFALHGDPPAGQHRGPPANPAAPGAITALTLEVPDAVRARAFYGTVLGWRFVPRQAAGDWAVLVEGTEARPAMSVRGGRGEVTVVPTFAVADLDVAVGAVHAASGTSTAPGRSARGRQADCTDDQGARFHLVQY